MDVERDTCPRCGADLRDKPIPPGTRFYESGQTHFMHTVGVEIQGRYDGVMYWMCPFCRGAWNRWPKGHHRHAEAQTYVDRANEAAAAKETEADDGR